jgi:hypothetical protein
MNRRGFMQLLGAGAAVTAAGLIVPDVARKFFLPPRGGWDRAWNCQLNVGDILTFEGVHDPLTIRKCKQLVVVGTDESGAYQIVRYDAAWTLPSGEQRQVGVDVQQLEHTTLAIEADTDRAMRGVLERHMREDGGRPGSTKFKLELPRNISDARYI